MTFMEAFDSLKNAMANADASAIDGHLAVQVNFTDSDASGICYIEVQDHTLYVEPYDYYDRNAMFLVDSKDLVLIMTGHLDFDVAVTSGRLTIAGDAEKAAEVKKLITPAPSKVEAAKEKVSEMADKAVAAAKAAAEKAAPAAKAAAEKAGEYAKVAAEKAAPVAKAAAEKAGEYAKVAKEKAAPVAKAAAEKALNAVEKAAAAAKGKLDSKK